MKKSSLESILKTKSFRSILESKVLAHLGDFLVNFLYTEVKVKKFDLVGSNHVWDLCLRTAMEKANLRKYLGKKTKPDSVADAGEALVAYAYYNQILSLRDMGDTLAMKLDITSFETDKREKEACSDAFSNLFQKIFEVAVEQVNFIEVNP